jgi:ATP-dependent Lon protease
MKINIEIDITPNEVKELYIPNENQIKLWKELMSQIVNSVQGEFIKNNNDFFNTFFQNTKTQKEFFEQFNKK